jgi:hypothetical protein
MPTIAQDVADVPNIQQRLLDQHPELQKLDRLAHQQQLVGSYVCLQIADNLPANLAGVGLFQPQKIFHGIGRISTGLGRPHSQIEPDFLGLMTAFQTQAGNRVDFLGINTDSAPTNSHQDFMQVLQATAASTLGWLNSLNTFVAQQHAFLQDLTLRLGVSKAIRIATHLTRQTLRTSLSRSAYQRYWSGIVEVNGDMGKFTWVPTQAENSLPALIRGHDCLQQQWQQRQQQAAIEFDLYWITYRNQRATPIQDITRAWRETHKQKVATLIFPQRDTTDITSQHWEKLATLMGANPANWVSEKTEKPYQPALAFEMARQQAYQLSQQTRNALDPQIYACVFANGEISDALMAALPH